jgi:hypothetical protein
MTRTENNKLLAEFLGYTQPHPDYPHTTYWYKEGEAPLTMLSFDTDWNWLVEVVKKCYLLDTSTGAHYEAIYYSFADLDIKKTYNACVEFVKHYNEKK